MFPSSIVAQQHSSSGFSLMNRWVYPVDYIFLQGDLYFLTLFTHYRTWVRAYELSLTEILTNKQLLIPFYALWCLDIPVMKHFLLFSHARGALLKPGRFSCIVKGCLVSARVTSKSHQRFRNPVLTRQYELLYNESLQSNYKGIFKVITQLGRI